MRVPQAIGDVADRITILRRKLERVVEPAARAFVDRELTALLLAWTEERLPALADLVEVAELTRVNAALWDIEDRLRALEADGEFGAEFVAAARAVYRLNDERALWKRRLNERLGSPFVEVKLYGADGSG